MKSMSLLVTIVVVLIAGLSRSTAHAQPVPPPRPDNEEGVQVLTRGPVHEAFAETVSYDPEPGIVVAVAPPNPIEEVPPSQRPEGVNVVWIPGYTAWDDERNDFLWVSGVWRAPPPGRQWVSGYWGRSSLGFQWTSGYWGDAQVDETEYLPEPPETVEVGPSAPPLSADQSWIPGSWIWLQGRYVWRPGYWVMFEPDWDWIPAHFTWTPRGYVFVDGYWDYSVARRGVLFAPIYFDPGVYSRRYYHYSPSVVISLSVFTDHLFVRPRYSHYYFGDYYDVSYQNAGFYSRLAFHSSRYGYDPIFAHERWRHRDDRDWGRRVEDEFHNRRDHIEARPPRTWTAQRTRDTSGVKSREDGPVIAASLDQWVKINDRSMRFKAVHTAEEQDLAQRGTEVRKFREERRTVEAQPPDRRADGPATETAPTKVRIGRSPIVAKRPEAFDKDRAPPMRHKAPEPDPRVQAKPRKARSDARAPKPESQGKRESPGRHPKVKKDKE